MLHQLMLVAEQSSGVYHRVTRLYSLTEWWHWLLLLAITAAVIAYVVIMYYHDSVELRRGVSWSLALLRLLAFAGILVFFLGLEKGTQQKITKNSRVLLLVDTSQSMGLRDADSTSVPAAPSRIDHVVAALSQGDLLAQLRERHDVVVYAFDQEPQPREIGSFLRYPAVEKPADAGPDMSQQSQLRQARIIALVAGMFLMLSLLAGASYLVFGVGSAAGQAGSWGLLVSLVSLLVAVVVLAVANLRHPDVDLLATIGLQQTAQQLDEESGQDQSEQASQLKDPDVDWKTALSPRGIETRLGEALRYLVNQERGGPVAGIALLSDGRSNAGVEYEAAVAAAQDSQIPIFTVGLGSQRRPVNVRVVDLEAPERVYPGDDFSVKGFVQSFGLNGRTVTVELVSSPAEPGEQEPTETFEDDLDLQLGMDGEMQPVTFQVSPREEGRRQYQLRVAPVQGDHDPNDNAKTANVEVVDEKNRVLLIAGGPTREYRFLRNLLYRDRDTIVDVWLQTGLPGISQEADNILFEFPKIADELFEYDCIVAFDPDWLALDQVQVQLLERWVAEKAGGLIVTAGPVYTPEWTRVRRGSDQRIEIIKALYPVTFISAGSTSLSLGKVGGDTPWPLRFTRDGLEAKFLWLEDEALESEKTWSLFGVFGYYAVRDRKEGAKVYARFSDPNESSLRDELPIYMAGHYYGAGRVFFQASGEMWRLRALETRYFGQYYTKLIRWVSQGRLLRDSSRGVLLVDKQRCFLGDLISVTAILTDAQHQPLQESEVTAILLQPDSTRLTLNLRAVKDAARAGTYIGHFTALQEGDYRVEVQPPEASELELLTQEVRSLVPALETEQPGRNDPLLKDIAQKTGGEYYIGVDSIVSRPGNQRAALAQLLESQEQTTYLPGTPDKQFQRLLMTWLMALICGALCLEWFIRRLSKLA